MRKLAMYLAAASAAVLVVMTVLSLATGASQEVHEHFALPEPYAMSLLAHAGALRGLMALDLAFLILYTAFFAALAAYLRERGQPFTRLALGFMIACAMLDVIEDHHILAMLRAAELGVLSGANHITFQAVESATKFSVSFASLVLFGIAVPRTTRLGWVLSVFLIVGTLANAVIGYALGPAQEASFDSGRWLGFLAGFALAIAWLWREPDAPVNAGAR
ncbi:MAG: hypothetical protein JO257_32875 [Deltaproteobacteria bacterium]|nr:hypothetical protein [Deltaproteobacteria bacterium]